ncbi:MAG: NADH-quinone oxidoreductase subunit NuoK [Nitrospiraceae bacterium]|nr:NADH-quinone oxidoreductase subunit NuoK [Nitrospiraceae bacterium]MDA8241657.1 NADH-quinone oxidoreductase subunit NuoK [Nitrospiraceae bacterium]
MVPLQWYLMLSAAVFTIGVFGFLTRRNIIIMFMSIELMLNAVNISLVSFSHYLQDLRGQILVFFIITVAAAEAAIGLAIIIALFRNKTTAHVDDMNEMKG